MNELMLKAWAKAQYAKQCAKEKAASLKSSFFEEDGGAEGIIIAIIMIIIVVALAIVFREQIGAWVNALFKSGTEEISNAANGSTPATVATMA